MSFKGKVVIVTGQSSSGIGASAAIEFVKEGAQVVIVGRNVSKLKTVEESCKRFGQEPLVIIADVSKDDDCKRIIDETIKKFGRIDVLVNNAGFLETTDITKDDFMETYDRIIGVNLRGVVSITHCSTPHLIKSKGNVINISSIAGSSTLALPNLISYCVSKAGVSHFTRCAALKLASYGVRVNTVSPGPVQTDILDRPSDKTITWDQLRKVTTIERVSEPEEIADLILFLASDKAKGITGSNFVTDNGSMIKN